MVQETITSESETDDQRKFLEHNFLCRSRLHLERLQTLSDASTILIVPFTVDAYPVIAPNGAFVVLPDIFVFSFK